MDVFAGLIGREVPIAVAGDEDRNFTCERDKAFQNGGLLANFLPCFFCVTESVNLGLAFAVVPEATGF